MSEAPVKIFSGRASLKFAEKLAQSYGTPLGQVSISVFSDGEFKPIFEDTMRGAEIFIIQSTFAPADNLLELLLMIDTAKRASAKRISAVIPYFGYARQDRKDQPRVPIGAKLIADLLIAAGVTRIITMDLHADQIQGFFNIPVDHLYASSIFIPYLKNKNLPNITMASPDTGGTKRAASYAKFLNSELVICYKQRSKKVNEIKNMILIGDVKGKDIILIDDLIDTAGTITQSAEIMMQNGASSVRALCTHPVFSGNAYDKINNSCLTEIITTDTIPLKETSDKITVLSSADLFADVIKRIISCESISTHFKLNTIL